MACCAVCSREIPSDSRVCPYCTAPHVGSLATASVREEADAPLDAARLRLSASDSIDGSRFNAGAVLTDRYRIVGLVGKGGMGEVYRADDLKLRQPVALKFLPEALSKDRKRLERFHHEVRIAREVSHPNVCRVYDIGEVDGQPFLTMEYVVGEDLASIIRRMGRPTKEKALQIARQLCAGLAAAHDRGILHRDLKPHNVMLDERGRVRITDFGLAGFVEQFTGAEVRAGTPAYMAPEQLEGRAVSVKSDLYALGLVFFELFTGRRLFEGKSREIADRSRSSLPSSLSQFSDDMDPAVERVILRCLEPDPAMRPSSALAVAAALPGGDPLGVALAAGETPSPEMVANAGEVGTMRPTSAFACFLVIVLGLILMPSFRDLMLKRVRLEKPPEALAVRATEILARMGHTVPAKDTAYDFQGNWPYLEHVEKTDQSPARWDRLGTLRPSPIEFWYRQSPRLMVPDRGFSRVSPGDPRFDVTGMATIWLDHVGRLISLEINPSEQEDEAELTEIPSPTDWSILFDESRLDRSLLTSTTPQWTPNFFCDERAAWTGHYPNQPELPVRVEAGAYRGKPVWYYLIHPWNKPWRMQEWPVTLSQKVSGWLLISFVLLLLVGCFLLARHNLRLRRGDRTGANRLTAAFFCLWLLSRLLGAAHVASVDEVWRIFDSIAHALFHSAILWLAYIALEPYVRRRWPHILISWGRLLAGRWRDPLVGRDILIGGVLATGAMVVHQVIEPRALLLSGAPPATPALWTPPTLLGGRDLFGGFLSPWTLLITLMLLLLFFGLRVALRKQWLALFAFFLLWSLPTVAPGWSDMDGKTLLVTWIAESLHCVLFALALIRFGLLAAVVMWWCGNIMWVAHNLDLSAWYAAGPLMALLIIIAITAFGLRTATVGRPLFRDELLDG